MPMQSQLAVVIEGHKQNQLAVSAAAAVTPVLVDGVYDCWCDVDVFIRVANTDASVISPNRAQDVTTATGFKIVAGNVVSVRVAGNGRCIGAIAGGAGTLSYHRTA